MFFVGATGQLLTLILTVCLPFVFLMSGQQKNLLLSNSNPAVEFHKNLDKDIQESNDSVDFETLSFTAYQDQPIRFEYFSPPPTKIADNGFCLLQKTIVPGSSGNKAPPSLI